MGKEYKIEIPPKARFLRIDESEQGTFLVYTFETPEQNAETAIESTDYAFEWIDFSKISKDYFLQAKMDTPNKIVLRARILSAISNNKLSGIYVQKYEPSVDKEGNLRFVSNVIPFVNNDVLWWKEQALAYCPSRGSRLATKAEYCLIIASLIQQGIINWEQAAEDSSQIGKYFNTLNSSIGIEKTGVTKCGKLFGFVGNTYKLVHENSEFSLCGGDFLSTGNQFQLGNIYSFYNQPNCSNNTTGLIVLTV